MFFMELCELNKMSIRADAAIVNDFETPNEFQNSSLNGE